jgi:hypothetical protein
MQSVYEFSENVFYMSVIKISYQVLAPAMMVDEVVKSDGMQCAAVKTNLLLRRVPPQRPPYMTNTCQGLEWAGFSTSPPTIRSEANKKITNWQLF